MTFMCVPSTSWLAGCCCCCVCVCMLAQCGSASLSLYERGTWVELNYVEERLVFFQNEPMLPQILRRN